MTVNSDTNGSAPSLVTSMIIGAEIWVPTTDYQSWELIESAHTYPELEFQPSVRPAGNHIVDQTGKRREILIRDTIPDEEWSQRKGRLEHGTCGLISLPFCDGDTLQAVVLLWMADAVSVAEAWGGIAGNFTLRLERVLAPGLDRWPRLSEHVQFPMGSGLPGRSWRLGVPVIESDLPNSVAFLRSSAAHSEQLVSGMALPITQKHQLRGVLSLLGSQQAPLGRGCEVWLPSSADPKVFTVHQSWYVAGSQLSNSASDPKLSLEQDVIGKIIAQRRPMLINNLRDEGGARGQLAADDGCLAMFGWPVIVGNRITAIALFLW